MTKPTVAVIMGGASFERAFSLASGKNVCRALSELGYGVLPLDANENLVDALRKEAPDAAFVALHGQGGEDGAVPSLLEFLSIPYVGSQPPVCRTTWSKPELPFVMRRLEESDATVARWPVQVALPLDAFKDLGAAKALDLVPEVLGVDYPLAVKPARGGSALGLTKVEGPAFLGDAILGALAFDDAVLIQDWVEGVELSVTVLDEVSSRGLGNPSEGVWALPPVEIRPLSGVFDIASRQDMDAVRYFCPPRATSLGDTQDEATRIEALLRQAACEVFRAFRCRDLARVDMIWDGYAPKVLDLKVFPGLTETSLVPMALEGADIAFEDFVGQLVEQAIERGA